jgi:hypothetical protein
MTALEDTGALNDPVGIAAEPLMEVIVGNYGVGNITAGADDPYAG